MGEQHATFAGLLRKLRTDARLTQEELAEASGVRPRSISDLERGVAGRPQRETVRLLADALNLSGLDRAQFEAAARGRAIRAEADITATVAAASRTLPRDISTFTGRQQQLLELMEAASDAGGVVGIHAIGGMAGIGKTAFAVHAAHRLADRFPAGQIFLPLHGHTPGQQPVAPGDALATLLVTLGVPAAQIPPGLEGRMALWRDRLAEKQLLLILDDAASSEQVRPLLPGAGGSLVLITSRRHLSALDDATAISLDTLPPREAAALFASLASRPGLSIDDPAVAEITRLCGYLPLAIGMVARQLHHHPAWSPAARAAELTAARDRLELMATENLSVAAAFDLSYADLTPDQQRLFRRLGLHPGSEFDSYAAAALDGTTLLAARRGLEALYDQYLLAEPTQGRYRLHDLIREHARVLSGRLDPDSDREAATTRLLDYYQHTAAHADALIARKTRPVPGLPTAVSAIAVAVPALASQDDALAWARAERASLLACIDHATGTGEHARVVALTAGIAGLLWRDGPWADAITRHTAAIQAAQYVGDRLSQFSALISRGDVRLLAGDYAGATQDLEEALGISRDLDDRRGQANALTYLGLVRRAAGDYAGAAQDLEEGLDISRDLDDRRGQANALTYLGYVRRMTGDYPAAVRDLAEALDLYRDLDNLIGQVDALSILGDVQSAAGNYAAAARHLEHALNVSRDLGSRLGQANALNRLGYVRRMTGDYPGAAKDLEDALGIYRELGDQEGESEVLNETGTLHRVRDDLGRARAIHQQALALARQISSAWHEADSLAGLGRCARAAGQASQAGVLLRQALEIFQRIGAAEAPELLAELDALTGSPPAQ